VVEDVARERQLAARPGLLGDGVDVEGQDVAPAALGKGRDERLAHLAGRARDEDDFLADHDVPPP
jgi:hypothetical protein